MEPIHYLRALRRRWWVIALSVLVAGAAAWVTTTDVRRFGRQASAAPPTEYSGHDHPVEPGCADRRCR